MKKFQLLLLLALGLFVQGYAQDRLIKGQVTDENGKPLAGANVNIKNTNTTVFTDSLGRFQITSTGQNKAALVVTFVGYSGTELFIKGGNFFTVQLKQTVQSLND